MKAVCEGENVDKQLDALFAPLLSEKDPEAAGNVLSPIRYKGRKPQQLRLAIEERKGYKGGAKGEWQD